MGALGVVGEGLEGPEANPVIIPYSLPSSYLIKSTNIQPLTAAHSSSAASARVSAFSAGAISEGSAGAFSLGSAGELSASDAFSVGTLGRLGERCVLSGRRVLSGLLSARKQGKTSC